MQIKSQLRRSRLVDTLALHPRRIAPKLLAAARTTPVLEVVHAADELREKLAKPGWDVTTPSGGGSTTPPGQDDDQANEGPALGAVEELRQPHLRHRAGIDAARP
jgi:hypothetical protein